MSGGGGGGGRGRHQRPGDPGSRRPRWARVGEAWLAAVVGREEAEALFGDLVEERRTAVEEGAGRLAAGWRFTRDLARSIRPLAWRRVRRAVAARQEVGRRRSNEPREERMGSWLQDVRYAARSLRKSPALTATVVLTLALGIGAGTTVFTVVDNVVLHPFAYPEVDRLVGVGPVYPKLGRELSFWEVLSPAEYLDLRDGASTLERVVAWDMGNRAVTAGDRTENLFSAFWWGDAFPTLGVRPALGRGFTAEEVEEGARVAVLSHRVWSNRFGADSALVGEAVLVNGDPYTLVGVMPEGTLIYGTDLWLPMPVQPSVFPRERRQFQVLARLAPGATMESVRAELELLADRTEAEYREAHPEYEGWRLVPMTWTDINVRMLKPAALALLGAIGFVLLLVCANVASLLLSRSATREREMAVRSALGARRGRILRQLLSESVLLAGLGAVAGVGVAWLAVNGLVNALGALSLPIPGEIDLDGRVLAFTAAVAGGSALLFGAIPAWYAGRQDVRGMLQAEGHGSTGGRGRMRLQRVFVGVEVALALVLLVGGGLLINSFVRLQAVDPGFDTEDLLTLRLTLAWERYEPEAMEPFLRELVRRLESEPAITAAATATQFPPLVFGQNRFWVEGSERMVEETLPTAYTTVTSPDYFRTLGLPVRAGRVFTDRDDAEAPRVAVLNDAAADRYFPNGDAIGKRLKLGGPDSEEPWFEVVGVVGSARNRGADVPPAPEMFASIRQLPRSSNQHFLVLRAPNAVPAALAAVRETVGAMDPQQPIYAVRTVEEAFAATAAERRIATVSLALFGLFALLLAAGGIYAVVAYAVSQRTREIGVRMALGANRGRVRRLVVRQALVPVAAGAALGLAGAVVVARLMAGLLFEVGTTDPATYIVVAAFFGSVALLASYIPARRASRLDPVLALRQEGR